MYQHYHVAVNCHPFLQYGPHDNTVDFSIRILEDSLASRIHASFVLILLDAPLPQFVILQGIPGAIGVSNFFRAFKMVSLNSLSSGSIK